VRAVSHSGVGSVCTVASHRFMERRGRRGRTTLRRQDRSLAGHVHPLAMHVRLLAVGELVATCPRKIWGAVFEGGAPRTDDGQHHGNKQSRGRGGGGGHGSGDWRENWVRRTASPPVAVPHAPRARAWRQRVNGGLPHVRLDFGLHEGVVADRCPRALPRPGAPSAGCVIPNCNRQRKCHGPCEVPR
jgi:hypothetical protein